MAEIRLVYYPGEEKLVSLDVLKLFPGEDIVQQEPADVDPDRWIDEGELTELPEISNGDGERVYMERRLDPVNPEIYAEPDLEIPMILDDPDEMAVREGIHERIQADIYHENKETAAQAEDMLEIPTEWNEVPDFIWENGDILPENMRPEKRRKTEEGRRYPGRKTGTFSYCISEDAKS